MYLYNYRTLACQWRVLHACKKREINVKGPRKNLEFFGILKRDIKSISVSIYIMILCLIN
jgi:hypothetical protein